MICLEAYSCDANTHHEDTVTNLVKWEMDNRRARSPCSPRTSAARPRGRHRSSDVILTTIMGIRGTHLRPPLTEGEVTELLAAANEDIITNSWYWSIWGNPRLGQALSQQLYHECDLPNGPFRNTMSWISRRQRIYLLLQALQFEERCRVRQLQKQLFDKVCVLIALDVIINRENLRRNTPEQTAFNSLLQQFMRQRRQLRLQIEALVHWRNGMARGFEPAHADIINNVIDRLNACCHQWQQMKGNAVLAQPPTHEQIRDYQRLEALEEQLNRIQQLQERIERFTDDLGSLNQVIRSRGRLGSRQIEGVSEEIRPMVRRVVQDRTLDESERQEINEERQRIQWQINELRLQRQQTNVGDIRREKRRLIGILNRGGLRQRIRRYLEMENAEQFRATQARRRDQFLRDFEALIRRHTSRRFTTLGDSDKWHVYQSLLDGLISGIGIVSFEHFVADVFVGYGPVNSDRDVGLRLPQGNTPPPTLSIGTYPGHGGKHALSAVDINTNDRLPFFAVAPDLLVLPARFGRQEEGSREEQFDYVSSAIVQSRTRVTNDLQDVFAKIAYGLLRPLNQGRTQSQEIERLMSDRELSDREVRGRITEERRHGAEQADALMSRDTIRGDADDAFPPEVGINPEAARILAGLAYHNLTQVGAAGVSERGLELLGRERQEILNAVEVAVRRNLGLSEDSEDSEEVRVFREGGIMADERGAGIRNLIVLRDRFRDVIQSVHEEIRSRGTIARRLWRFLWDLRGAGAQPSRAGQAVTVDHVYRSRSNRSRSIVVRVFNAHVASVGNITARCQPLGQIGTTGNAVSYHNHVEIALYPIESSSGQARQDDLIGFLLPHEFFPLL